MVKGKKIKWTKSKRINNRLERSEEGITAIHSLTHSIINSVICLMTGPQPLPKRVLHTVRSSASSFNFWYPVCFLNVTQKMRKSSSSFTHHFYPSLLLNSKLNSFHTYINNTLAYPQSSTDFFVDTLLLQPITLTSCYLIIQNTNVMHLILFIRQIFSSTCFE